ncbi:uncharacterized protein [Scyliorhinus torazame]|uniref:uncharacterized protein n=1 Tax=Scyliorhinus torazame TaxID=75743 RepID=UPI003B5A4ABD
MVAKSEKVNEAFETFYLGLSQLQSPKGVSKMKQFLDGLNMPVVVEIYTKVGKTDKGEQLEGYRIRVYENIGADLAKRRAKFNQWLRTSGSKNDEVANPRSKGTAANYLLDLDFASYDKIHFIPKVYVLKFLVQHISSEKVTITIRLVRSFEHRNFRHVVYHDVNVNQSVKEFLNFLQNDIPSKPGLAPPFKKYTSCIKNYSSSTWSKTNDLVSLDNDDQCMLKGAGTLKEAGVVHETEMVFFKSKDYETFKKNPAAIW